MVALRRRYFCVCLNVVPVFVLIFFFLVKFFTSQFSLLRSSHEVVSVVIFSYKMVPMAAFSLKKKKKK